MADKNNETRIVFSKKSYLEHLEEQKRLEEMQGKELTNPLPSRIPGNLEFISMVYGRCQIQESQSPDFAFRDIEDRARALGAGFVFDVECEDAKNKWGYYLITGQAYRRREHR